MKDIYECHHVIGKNETLSGDAKSNIKLLNEYSKTLYTNFKNEIIKN